MPQTVVEFVSHLKGLSLITQKAVAHLLWVYGPREKLPRFLERLEVGEGLWGSEFWVNQTLKEQSELMKDLCRHINEGTVEQLTTAVLAILPEHYHQQLKITFPLPVSM